MLLILSSACVAVGSDGVEGYRGLRQTGSCGRKRRHAISANSSSRRLTAEGVQQSQAAAAGGTAAAAAAPRDVGEHGNSASTSGSVLGGCVCLAPCCNACCSLQALGHVTFCGHLQAAACVAALQTRKQPCMAAAAAAGCAVVRPHNSGAQKQAARNCGGWAVQAAVYCCAGMCTCSLHAGSTQPVGGGP